MSHLGRIGQTIRTRWRALAIAATALVVSFIAYQYLIALPDPAPPAIDTSEKTVYFPQMESSGHDVLAVDVRGAMTLDDQGCLRLGGPEGRVIIWPNEGYAVDLVNDLVALVDEETGEPIAYEGDWISLGGAIGYQNLERTMGRQLPEACADADNYTIAGSLNGIERITPEPLLIELTSHYDGYQPRAWFLQRETGVGHTFDGDRAGELVLDDEGCLRLDDEDGPVLIWPSNGIELDWFGPDVMLKRISSGETIAQVGDTIHVGGQGPVDEVDDDLATYLPVECADGEFWMTGPLNEIERVSS